MDINLCIPSYPCSRLWSVFLNQAKLQWEFCSIKNWRICLSFIQFLAGGKIGLSNSECQCKIFWQGTNVNLDLWNSHFRAVKVVALVCISLKIPRPWPTIVSLSKQVSTTDPDSVLSYSSILTAVEVIPIYKQNGQCPWVPSFSCAWFIDIGILLLWNLSQWLNVSVLNWTAGFLLSPFYCILSC